MSSLWLKSRTKIWGPQRGVDLTLADVRNRDAELHKVLFLGQARINRAMALPAVVETTAWPFPVRQE